MDEPLPGTFKAFGKTNGGFVSENLFRFADVGPRLTNVSTSSRLMGSRQLPSDKLLKDANHVEQRVTLAVGNIEGFPRRFRFCGGQEIGLHNIFNVSEVTRLLPIGMDF